MKKTLRQVLMVALIPAVTLLVYGCANEAPVTGLPGPTDATATSVTTDSVVTDSADAISSTASTGPGEPEDAGSPPAASTPATTEKATTFAAVLSGAEVVPGVDTPATGSATFVIEADGSRAFFKLTLADISDVIASRVHEGRPGANGRGVLILYPGPTVIGPVSGVLAQGNFNASVLIGSLTGKTLADLAVLLQSGQAYVNVGTTLNPEGEIRGQIYEQR